MPRRPASRMRVLVQAACALLAVYLCLVAAALHKRETSLNTMNERIVSEATYCAEHGPVDYDKYLYGYPSMPWQTGAVYLFEHGRCDPRVERILLLIEARRSYDGQYISSYAMNTDLRHWLIERCLAQYPDDLRVAWAIGRLSLILGDFDVAAEQLTRARELGIDPADIGEPAWALYGRLITAYVLSGRGNELEPMFLASVDAVPDDTSALGDLAEYYCLCDRQDDAIALLADSSLLVTDSRLQALLRRAYWWGGHLEEYRAAAVQAAEGEGKPLYSFDPRLALLDGDQAAFDLQLPPGNANRWRALAEAYAVTKRSEFIRDLEQAARYFSNAPREGLSWQAQRQLEQQSASAYGQAVRALILAGEWEAALNLHRELDGTGGWYSAQLPTTAGNDALLGVFAGESPDRYSWGLGDLAEALPYFLLSRCFDESVAHNGGSTHDVMLHLADSKSSYHASYYDYGNGVFEPACPR